MKATEFNALYEVGVPVFAYTGFRPEVDADARRLVTRTRSRAELFQGHTDVVWVEGHGACIQLSHVDVVSEDVWEAARTADAVAALPMPVGTEPTAVERLLADAVRLAGESVAELKREHEISSGLRAELSQAEEDRTGACLARWEEEQENARLRLAWRSARERAQAYGEGILRITGDRESYQQWLKQEQGVTQQLRDQIAALLTERHETNESLSKAMERLTELEALTPAVIQTCQKCGAAYTYGEPCSVCLLQVRIDAERAKREVLDGEHYQWTHRDLRKGHDLQMPETGGAK